MWGCGGRYRNISTSALIDSEMALSIDRSIIFTAYSFPVSLDTHFLTVLDSPLLVGVRST